ncbi:MAG TPA: hypothetical protein VK554_14915, partial [Bradyrhizobium sp.]|nr:hypothetical protein [Bradyrhizobium sp.]
VIVAGPPLPAAVTGANPRRVVEQVLGLGKREIPPILSGSITATRASSMTCEVMGFRLIGLIGDKRRSRQRVAPR